MGVKRIDAQEGSTPVPLGIGALRNAGHAVLRTVLVEVPQWGGTVMLRELNGAQRTQMIEKIVDLYRVTSNKDMSGADLRAAFESAAQVVKLTWVDADGNPVIANQDDYDLLLRQPLDVVMEVAGEALKLSGMAPDAVTEAKKNSTKTRKPVSGSSLPPS